MYLETIEKTKVLKELLEKNLVKSGNYPDNRYVKRLLADIDERLAILDYENVKPGALFDTEKFNDNLYCIAKDLDIIYSVIDKFATEKYIELEAFVNGYLSSLEEIAKRADQKSIYETETTSLNADVVYFTDTAPSISFENQKGIIEIGALSFEAQSKIIAYINGSGFEYNNVVFSFDDKYFISPYPVNRDYVKNEGTIKENRYEYNIDEDQIVRGTMNIKINEFKPNQDYSYQIYGEESYVNIRSSAGENFVKKENNVSISVSSESFVSFYLIDGSYINFDFSTTPIFKNFNDYEINNIENAAYFEFRLQAGASFNFDTNGKIYATKEKPAVYLNELYLSTTTKAKNFLIIEKIPGTPITYNNVKVTLHDILPDQIHINSIAIKQISDLR